MINLISRVGGKYKIRKEILAAFPPKESYDIYCEPFVGAGHIFLNSPTVKKNVMNDLDSFISTLFQDIQEITEEEIDTLDITPTREKWDFYKSNQLSTPFERVQQSLFINKNSFSSKGLCYSGKRITPSTNSNFKKNLIKTKQVLKDKSVIFENKDYSKILDEWDSPTTFFYLDPPYFKTYKSVGYNTFIDPDFLCERLKKIQGRFLLSFNDHPYINKIFGEAGFKIQKIETIYGLCNHKGSIPKTEIIISNY